jgi:predicted nucleic acid-binding protein
MARARIGQGEAEAILLAKERSVPVILDDAEARAVARSLGLDYLGTLMLPYQAFVRKILSREELVEILTGLGRVLWVSPDVIAEILRRAEGIKE